MNKVEIVAHSVDKRGNELLSVLVTFPRIILAEINTHRMLSKNTSSSRAIPALKMIEVVEENPFTFFAWQKKHSGMQGSEYFTDTTDINRIDEEWLEARDSAVTISDGLRLGGVTKQATNRLLEPFMWTTMLITGPVKNGGWDNFFNLRCPDYYIEKGFIARTGEFVSVKGDHYKSKKDCLKEINKYTS